jgi:hydrogenase maturation protease
MRKESQTHRVVGVGPVLVIGVGNPYGGDDAVGPIVSQRLKERVPGHVSVIEHTGDGAALMELWKGAPEVIVVDAASSGAAPGAVHRFEAHAAPLPAKVFRHSTHAFGVPEAIEMSRALNQLPPRLIVYGIEGRNFAAGAGLSPDVESSLPIMIERVLKEIDTLADFRLPIVD